MREKMKRANRLHVRQQGSYLLEVLIAMLLFAFGILGLIGLLASSVRASNDARYRTEAANLANGMIADMWTMTAAQMNAVFCAGCTKLTAWTGKASSLLPSASAAVDLTQPGLSSQSSTVKVTITWQHPGSTEQHNYIMTAQIGRNPP
jgi:type IV pilus assembly protein PilV